METQQLLLYGERLLSLRNRVLKLWHQLAEPLALCDQLIITRCVEMVTVFSSYPSLRGFGTPARSGLMVVLDVFYLIDQLLEQFVILDSELSVHEVIAIDGEDCFLVGRLLLLDLMQICIPLLVEVKVVLNIWHL